MAYRFVSGTMHYGDRAYRLHMHGNVHDKEIMNCDHMNISAVARWLNHCNPALSADEYRNRMNFVSHLSNDIIKGRKLVIWGNGFSLMWEYV